MTAETLPRPDMSTWKVIWSLVRFQGVRYVFINLAFTSVMLAELVLGLVSREFFNLISHQAPAGFNFWTLMVFLALGALVRMGGIFGVDRTNMPYMFLNHTLLQKNLLRQILRRPGAQALPESTGESISRFREDVFELPLFGLIINSLWAALIWVAVAVAIMLSINARITLLLLAPMLG